tara:strand:- start:226 stop:558 length:333 start_codon:yes stop_codon:yes gene_type:complete
MEIKSEDGKVFQFPYVILFNQKVSIPTIGKSKVVSIKYDVKKQLSDEDIFNIKRQILCCPYVINPASLSVELFNNQQKKILSIKLLILNSIYIQSLKQHVDDICENLKVD